MAEFIIHVKVIPGSRKNSIEACPEGIKVKLHAPAVEGKANKALISYLSDFTGIKKNRITLIRGELNRDKLVRVECSQLPEQLKGLINPHSPG